MCGIVAVVSRRPVEADVLTAMRDRLAHRGPDGVGAWSEAEPDSSIALGFRRLAIIDLSQAAGQPMLSSDGNAVIVHNGEIYNFVELREELSRSGRRFRTRGDTEVLLASYLEWGPQCLERLNGMFAFVIWDRRRKTLFAARDRFGEKPLFYARLPCGGLAIASEVKALMAHPDLDATPNEAVLDAYVAGTYFEDGRETFFRGVSRLPAAHAMEVDRTGEIVSQWRFWTADYSPRGDDYREDAAVAHFREHLERSVRLRLRSDVPVGTSLSGGLDSTVIVGLLASQRDEHPLLTQNTFSARFDHDSAITEGREIDVATRFFRVSPFATTPDPDRLIAESELLHWHQEEPFLSASIFAQWCVMSLAEKNRTTVLLDGQGADELLAGYQYYFPLHQLDLLDRRKVGRLLRETFLFTRRLRRVAQGFPDSRRRFDPEVALGPRELAGAWLRRRPLAASSYSNGVPAPEPGLRLRRVMAEALQYNSLSILLRYADRNAMAFGRETRFPFLDYNLVDWCTSLPEQAFVRNGWQKYILRRAAEGLIPPAIQWRADKVGYAAPLDRWLRGPLRRWAEKRLFSSPVTEVPGYDRAAVQRLWSDHQAGAENSWALWRWISLQEWFGLLENGRWKEAPAVPDRRPTPEIAPVSP